MGFDPKKYGEGVACPNTSTCTNCENGLITGQSSYCPTHSGASYGHYWCSTHNYNCGTSRSHSCCEHSRMAPHDD